MKFCSFPGFFHILAKSPGVPPTAFHSRPWPPVPIIWSEGESTTYCPKTIGADPLVRQRDFGGAATTPGGSLGEAREELRRLLLEEAWEARQGWRRLLLETLPEMLRDPAQTFAGGYFLEANWRKGHEAPSNEILQFPWVFPHFGQKSWGPPHGF